MTIMSSFVPGVADKAWCSRCKRSLSNPTSVRLGIGPICRGRHGGDGKPKEGEFSDKPLDTPLTEGIVCERRVDGVYTNVPHLVVWHSPDGFEFGFGGSGPSDLALNALEAYLRMWRYKGETAPSGWKEQETIFVASQMLHQDFKAAFIARMDLGGGTVPVPVVRSWVMQKLAEIGQPPLEEPQ